MMPRWIAKRAAQLFFLIIFLQIPLFRIPWRGGICTTPLQVAAAQLCASRFIPLVVVKSFLYPGAFVQNLITGKSLPTWGTLLEHYNLTLSQPTDIYRLEILAGSYFAVAGSLVALAKPGRMSLFGSLLLVWGLIREGFLGDPSQRSKVHVYPTLLLALVCAVFSIRYDMQKVQKLTRPLATPLKSSSKSKIK